MPDGRRRPPRQDPDPDPQADGAAGPGPGAAPREGPDAALGGAGPQGERLQKVLARVGLGSRRACEELIAEGRVSVNGEPATLGRRVDVGRDAVALDGVPLPVLPGLVHYLLHKPAGVVTTAEDPQGRPTVVQLVPDEPRVFPVGRLDADSEGLLVLTNDGDLAHRLAHPSFGVEKEYLVETMGVPTPGALRRLRQGVDLDDGTTAPARVGVVAPGVLRIVVHEGRNRQVRRMCEAVGFPVRRLVRTRIGPLTDARLAPGRWRPLTGDEVRALARAAVPRPGPGRARRPPGRPGRPG
ncbi:MAG TPA: pseudouridine synthase [Acidimicrobiales bacterium]|nr:pseudouridine synthase [Acidimicrobiales bacterium]